MNAPAYETAPYSTELTTRVVETGREGGRDFVLLEDTILYPEGGGQPSDRGSVNGVPIVEVTKVGSRVRHFVTRPVAEGVAELTLDWTRRFDHMQQHTAQHLLSALALELYGWRTTSFHLGELRSDIELDTPAIESGTLESLEESVMREIRAARPVLCRRVPAEELRQLEIRTRGLPEGHEGDVRLVEIEGIDMTTCGGTHLSSTAEIESVQLGPSEGLRGGTRLFWIAGGRVRKRLATLEKRNLELRRLLETSGDELLGATTTRLEALRQERRASKRLAAELADARAAALAASDDRFVEAHFDHADGGLLQAVARGLLERAPEKTALLTATGDSGSYFSLVAGGESGAALSELGPRVAEALGGRGGGSKNVFQGKAPSLEGRSRAVELLDRS